MCPYPPTPSPDSCSRPPFFVFGRSTGIRIRRRAPVCVLGVETMSMEMKVVNRTFFVDCTATGTRHRVIQYIYGENGHTSTSVHYREQSEARSAG